MSDPSTKTRHVVARAGEIPPGSRKLVSIDGKGVVVFNLAGEFFALKRRLDPDFRLRNVLWDRYYAPTLQAPAASPADAQPRSEFHTVYGKTASHDAFYRFP